MQESIIKKFLEPDFLLLNRSNSLKIIPPKNNEPKQVTINIINNFYGGDFKEKEKEKLHSPNYDVVNMISIKDNISNNVKSNNVSLKSIKNYNSEVDNIEVKENTLKCSPIKGKLIFDDNNVIKSDKLQQNKHFLKNNKINTIIEEEHYENNIDSKRSKFSFELSERHYSDYDIYYLLQLNEENYDINNLKQTNLYSKVGINLIGLATYFDEDSDKNSSTLIDESIFNFDKNSKNINNENDVSDNYLPLLRQKSIPVTPKIDFSTFNQQNYKQKEYLLEIRKESNNSEKLKNLKPSIVDNYETKKFIKEIMYCIDLDYKLQTNTKGIFLSLAKSLIEELFQKINKIE